MMKKSFKKVGMFFLSLACFSALAVAGVACNETSNGGVEVGVVAETVLDLNYRYYELEIYDNVTLVPIVQKVDGEIEWESSDETIATITQDGFVEGMGEGEVTITATIDEYYATCRIVVVDHHLVPEVRVESENLSLAKNDSFMIQPTLYYNNKKVEGVQFDCVSSNEDVLTVVDGEAQGVAYGNATVTLSTQWKHFSNIFTSKIISVNVVPNVGLRVTNAEELTLYTISELDGKVYDTQKTVAFEYALDGEVQALPASAITWSVENADIAVVSNGELVALKAGDTTVSLEYTTTIAGQTFDLKTQVVVKVERPIMQKSGEFLIDTWIDKNAERDKTRIVVSPMEFFGENENSLKVIDVKSGYEYDLVNNAFKNGVKPFTGERTWIVYNEKYGVEASVVVADMVIENVNDLRVFDESFRGALYGYFVLNNDINYLGQNFGFKSVSFYGTLDGRGHVLSNLRLDKGLFWNIGVRGVIKNLGLVDFTLSSSNEAGAFASTCLGELNNVYANGVSYANDLSGTFAFRFYEGAVLKDSVAQVEYTGTGEVTNKCGAFAANIYSMVTIENCYAITTTYAGTDGTNFVGSESIGNLDTSKAGIYPTLEALKASNKITNSILLEQDLQIGVDKNELLGYTALSANMPVSWSVEQKENVAFNNGVLTTESETAISVLVQATSLADPTKTATQTVVVRKATVAEKTRAEVNALSAEDNRYAIAIPNEILVNTIISATLGLDMYQAFTNLQANTQNNTISLPCAVITSGVNTLYLNTLDGYYKMPVLLTIPETTLLGSVEVQGEANGEEYTISLGETLQVKEVKWAVSEIDLLKRYEALTIDETKNSIQIPAEAVLDGQTTLYVGTASGYYSVVVKNWLASTPISTAQELAKALNDRSGNNYYLTRDIDMTGVSLEKTAETVNNVEYNRTRFVGNFDGNNHSITGVNFTTNWLYALQGKLNNVAIYATGNIAETTGKTGYLFFISQLIGGSEMRNVYVKLTVDLNAKSTHAEAVNGKILESTFGIFEDGKDEGSTLLENFLFDVSYLNETYEVGEGDNKTTVSISKTPVFMYRFNHIDVTMRNVYVLNSSTTYLLRECRSTAKGSLFLQNGNDETLVVEATAQNTYSYGGEYTYANMSRFYRSDYAKAFKGELFANIVKFDAESFWVGYTPISTADELVFALSSSARVKYYLTQDIDMSGKSLTGYFGGTLEGDGHKVYGISYTGNSYIKEIESATIQNVAFYATREISVGTTAIQEFSFIGNLMTSTLTNVYIELTLDGNNATCNVYGGVIGHTHNGNVAINMTNVVGHVQFVECDNVKMMEFGFLWRVRLGTVNMTNVYMLGTESKANTSANVYLIRLFYATKADQTRNYTIANGGDATITETHNVSDITVTPSNIAQGKYCFKDLTAFKQSGYANYLNDEVHLWDGVLDRI